MAERELTAGAISAIVAGVVRPVLFTELEYVSGGAPAYLRLFTGIGQLSWDGKTWTGGRDLLGISPIRESRSLTAIGFSVQIAGMPAAQLSIALQSMRKNRSGKVWLGFFEPAGYLSLPGTFDNHASTPDSVASSITGDLDLRIKLAAADWTPVNGYTLISKWQNPSQRSYILSLDFDGTLILGFTADGTTTLGATSTAAISAAAGQSKWIRATIDVDNGAAGRTIRFYTSDDYDPDAGAGTWSQLGADVVTAGVTSIADTATAVQISSHVGSSSSFIEGNVFHAEIRNGIDGPVVARFDPRRFSSTNLTAEMLTGEAWTINQSGGTPARIVPLPDELIADPYLLRRGRFDIAPITRDGDTMTIEARYEDRLVDLERPRERRYTHEDQQLRLAGDKGFEQVPELQDAADVWGEPGPVVNIPNPVGGGRSGF